MVFMISITTEMCIMKIIADNYGNLYLVIYLVYTVLFSIFLFMVLYMGISDSIDRHEVGMLVIYMSAYHVL